MPTNDERREVAARLRSVTPSDYLALFLEEILEGCLKARLRYDADGDIEDELIIERLADLIEPEPERTGRYFVSDLFPEDGIRCLTCKEWVAADNYCGNCGVKLVN